MIKKIWKWLIYLLFIGLICISTTYLFNAAYISCYIFLCAVYIIFSYNFINAIYKKIAKKEDFFDSIKYHTNWKQKIVLFILISIFIMWLILLCKSWIFDYISQRFAYIIANTFNFPGHWKMMEINLE